MSTATDPMLKVARLSRRAAVLSLLGFVVVIASLLYSAVQLNRTEARKEALEAAMEPMMVASAQLKADTAALHAQVYALRIDLAAARKVAAATRAAIIAFHAKDYAVAIALYDEALSADPSNAYVLNLRAYSLFKMNRIDEAISTGERCVQADTTYAWGYFDLARFQCAAGQLEKAKVSLNSAIRLNPQMRLIAKHDGEFMRHCKSIW